jgi:hypothetical protein
VELAVSLRLSGARNVIAKGISGQAVSQRHNGQGESALKAQSQGESAAYTLGTAGNLPESMVLEVRVALKAFHTAILLHVGASNPRAIHGGGGSRDEALGSGVVK